MKFLRLNLKVQKELTVLNYQKLIQIVHKYLNENPGNYPCVANKILCLVLQSDLLHFYDCNEYNLKCKRNFDRKNQVHQDLQQRHYQNHALP